MNSFNLELDDNSYKTFHQHEYIELLKINLINYDSFQLNDFRNDRFNINDQYFLQRFVAKKFLNDYFCDKIIEESEKYAVNNNGWTTERHSSYPTTDCCLKEIKNILPLFFEHYDLIINLIKDKCNIENGVLFIIQDAFIVKYEHDKQCELEMHSDGGDVTVNILLSNSTDFEGGGTLFIDDNLTYLLEKGDMLIHRGNDRHSALKVTSGKRYVLVIFFETYNI